MTTAVRVQPPPAATGPATLPRWIVPVAGFLLSATASIACLVAAGPIHGVLFGAALTAALLTPILATADHDWATLLLIVTGVALGCVAGPLVALLQGELNGRLFSATFAVVVPLVVALGGVAALLTLCRLPAAAVAALLTLLALLWLGWPIWLSHWLPGNEALVARLSPAHPLLTIDAAITREGGVSWLEHRLMYAKLTVLGQHVFPRQPIGVAAAASWHGGIGLLCLAAVTAVQLGSSRRRRPLSPPAPAATRSPL